MQKYATFVPVCCLVLGRAINLRDHAYFVFYCLLQFKISVDFCHHRVGVLGTTCARFHRAALAQKDSNTSQLRITREVSGPTPRLEQCKQDKKVYKLLSQILGESVETPKYAYLQNGLCCSFLYTHFALCFHF